MAELTRAAAGRGRETHGRRRSRRAQVRGGLRARSPCRWCRGTRARLGTERASPTQATASRLLPRGACCRPRCPVGPRRGAGAGLPPASSLARCWFTPSLGWDAAGGGAADAGCQAPRTGAGGGLGCSKKVTLFPFHWIKRLKLCLAFAAGPAGECGDMPSLAPRCCSCFPGPSSRDGPGRVREAGMSGRLLSLQRGHVAGEHWTRSCVPHGGAPSPPMAGVLTVTEGRPPRAGAGPGVCPRPRQSHPGPSRPSAIWCLKETHPYMRVK